MTISERLLPCWVLLLLLCPQVLTSEQGGKPDGFYGYSFINPKITEFDAEWAPFFLDVGEVYTEYFKSEEEVERNENATEWRERFCDKPRLVDIEYVLYQASQYELQDLRAAMANSNVQLRQLGRSLAANSWTSHLHKHQCRETVDYLIYAKQCEPYAVAPADDWDDQTVGRRQNTAEMRRLIEEAKKRFLRIESHYIKLRYAYQAIRMAHYLRDYELTLELIDYYLPKIDNDPSVVEYWIIGHKAGALQAQGKQAEAAYLYSRVFEQCPGRRQSAFRSFRVDTDEEWQEALLLCKNDHERATMYVLRASTDNAHLVEEMRNIYQYDPKHHALEMLLIREMQNLEKDLLAADVNPYTKANRSKHGVPRDYAGERVIALQALVREWEDEGLVEEPALWKLAEGYLEVLAGDFYFAQETFAEAEELVDDKNLEEQLEVFQLVLRILSLGEASVEVEEELAELPREYKFYENYPDFNKLVTDKLRVLYRQEGDGSKAYMMEYGLSQLRAKPDIDIIDELIALCEKEKRTRFEAGLVEKEDGSTILNELLDVKAAYYMKRGALESALRVMEQIPEDEWDLFGYYNPFVRRFDDCVNCKLPDSVTTFNRGQLIQRMLEKDYEAREATDADVAASLYFDLGEAHYNITYFGNSWRATDCFRSAASAARAYKNKGQTVFSQDGLPLGNVEHFNTERARRYFDLARRTAQNMELQAAAAYMAAKCERNAFYVENERRTFDYFRILQEEYQETQFYRRVIQECRDFQAYVLK